MDHFSDEPSETRAFRMGILKPHFRLLLGALACVLGSASANLVISENCVAAIPALSFFDQSSPGYAAEAQPFNRRLDPTPAIVAVPQTVSQIQAILQCANANNITVSARSGGHSYAAWALSGDIVVDMSNMNSVTLQPDNVTAVVQTGTRLGNLALSIFEQGGRALPHGSCPYVGTGGHTLYGGFGYFGRIGGLLLDTVVSADVVLANGTLVTVSSTSHPELFTAIRGGGPSFGLVVSWTYQTLPAPPTTVRYNITFPRALSVSQATKAFSKWEKFLQNQCDELAAAAEFRSASQGNVTLKFVGNYYGTQEEALELLTPFVNSLPSNLSARLVSQPLGWIEGLEAFAGGNGNLNTSIAPDAHDTFYAKSLIRTSPDSESSINAFINYLATNGSQGQSDTDWFVQIDLYGGQIARVGNYTSFDHRSAFLVYQFYASSPTFNLPYPSDGVDFVNGIVRYLDSSPAPPGYPNYIDPTLTQNSLWKQAYFPTKANQLQSIKSSVDPFGVFNFPEGF